MNLIFGRRFGVLFLAGDILVAGLVFEALERCVFQFVLLNLLTGSVTFDFITLLFFVFLLDGLVQPLG